MDALRYIAILAAVFVGLLLLARPTWGFLGLLVLLPMLNRLIPKLGPGLNAETFLFAAALLGALIWMRPALPPIRDSAPILAYMACVVFGFALLMTQPGQLLHGIGTVEWVKGLKADLWPTLLFFVAFALAPGIAHRRLAFICLTVALVIFSLNGLIDSTMGSIHGDDYSRASGVLAKNPNILGGAIAILSAFPLVGMTSSENSNGSRLLYLAVYVLGLVVLVLTQSRGAWLGFTVGHVVWLAFKNRVLFLPVVVSAALLFTTAYSLSLLPEIVSSRIAASTRANKFIFQGSSLAKKFDASIGSRITYHVIGAEMFMDSPIWGHGYRSFRLLALRYGAKYGVVGSHQVAAESILLSVAVSNGLIGLTIMFWVCWLLASYARSLMHRDNPERDLALVLVFVMGAVGTMSLTLNALWVHEIALPFWLVIGLAARSAYELRVARAAERRPAWHQLVEAPA